MTVFQRILIIRGLRGYSDGCISLVLPFYLTSLGLDALHIGVIATATMLGSGVISIGAGLSERRHGSRVLLLGAALLMTLTGLGFFSFSDFWPLLVVAFIGTINPSNGDVSLFLPLEHTTIAATAAPRQRAGAFAKYSLTGSLCAALGALSAGLPQWLAADSGIAMVEALKLVFLFYAGAGLIAFFVYRGLPARPAAAAPPAPRPPLVESRGVVMRLTAMFALDTFAGGFMVQSLLALWLFQRFELPIAAAGTLFFWVNLIAACSYPVSVWLYKRIGAVRTMVYTSVPTVLIYLLIPFMPSVEPVIALLLLRSLTASMDVPVRAALVMNAVPEHERAAAASITTLPKNFVAGISPSISGWMLSVSTFGWPLIASGLFKLAYIVLFMRMFHDLEARQAGETREAGESNP